MEPTTEKPRGPGPVPSNAGPRRRRSNRRLLWGVSALLAGLWALGQYGGGGGMFHRLDVSGTRSGGDRAGTSEINWDDIPPSEKLEWHPCGLPFHCARLTVPMDYHRPLNESADHPKVHLALLLVPGAGRPTNPRDGPAAFAESPLLLNPGGPGGSGAIFARLSGRQLQGIVGRHHDIVGFDPRGVGATTPVTNCFAASGDDEQGLPGRNVGLLNRLSWLLAGHDVGLVNSSNVALGKLDVRARALGRLCRKVADGDGKDSIFQYANTANVARDMLSIIDAWDAWRNAAALGITGTQQDDSSSAERTASGKDEEIPVVDTQPAPSSNSSTKGKLVYLGLSYGTLLGATFAAMFPDRVGRLVLDGVVDADHYVEPAWLDNLVDTDAIWEQFFTDCHAAGPTCPLFRSGDDAEAIRDRVYALLDRLQEQPAIAISPEPDANVPGLVTASDVKAIVFASLYAPNTAFPALANLLNIILEDRLDEITGRPILPALCHHLDLPVWPDDAPKAIMCSDKRYTLNESVPALQVIFEEMASYSWFADVMMSVFLDCNGWAIEAKDPPMRWDDHPARKPAPIHTDFPLLFLSNRRDPVTPLRAARKMARKFADARLVEQAADGHCTLACISLCTLGHIRAYINDGVLPPLDDGDNEENNRQAAATCECDEKPWPQGATTFRDWIGDDAVTHLQPGKLAAAAKHDTTTAGSEEYTAEDLETMALYRSLRGHFISQMMPRVVDELNPLRQFLVDAPSHPIAGSQTCT